MAGFLVANFALWLQRKHDDDKKNRSDDAKNRQVPVKQVLLYSYFKTTDFLTHLFVTCMSFCT